MSRERYDLGELLGSGHFGAVYRAKHKDLGHEVALKLLELRHPDARSYLLEEGRRMASLPQHDNIVQVHDAGDWDGDHVYLAVEMCEGGSLEDLCAGGPLDPQRACRLISDACRGLHELHVRGMFHLDVRPSNILLGKGLPKLSDFGLARPAEAPKLGDFYSQHAAPELIVERIGSAKTDQYAAAMTLGHLLTAGAYCRAPVPQPVTQVGWRDHPDPSVLGLHIPDRLRRVLKKATSFQPDARYGDVEAFKQALDRATPALAFLPAGDDRLKSSDESVEITWLRKQNLHHVEVRVGGRRKSSLECQVETSALRQRHVSRLLTSYAYPD